MKTSVAKVNESNLYKERSFLNLNYNLVKKKYKKRILDLERLQAEQYAAMKSAK